MINIQIFKVNQKKILIFQLYLLNQLLRMSHREQIRQSKTGISFEEQVSDLSEFRQNIHVPQIKNLQYGEILKIIIAIITTSTLILLLIAAFSKPNPPIIDKAITLNMERQMKAHPLDMPHNHQEEEWLYPTLGRPTKDTIFNYTDVSPDHFYQFQKKMDSLVRPYNDTDCQYARYGHQSGDGGYLVCENIIAQSKGLINIGIQAFDEFGCQFSAANNAVNYQFDCTDKVGYKCFGLIKNVKNQVCLSDRSEWTPKYVFSSLKDMVDGNGLTGKRISLKLDGQGSEWDGLRTFPLQYLDNIDQIFMEIHLYPEATIHNRRWGDLDILARIEERFVSVNYNENNAVCYSIHGLQKKHYFTSPGFQITLVNKKYIKINKPTRTYKQHPLNKVSFDWIPYRCPMQD